MKRIVDWDLYGVGAGSYFRFIFDDFTWGYSDFVIKDASPDELLYAEDLEYELWHIDNTVEGFKEKLINNGHELIPR